MKVIEKDTNRSAQVHLHALGVVNPLDEYGEWVDPVDNALCCFVPVEGGQKIKVEGRFVGTTKDVQFDVSIDGVCRKAHTMVSKTVQAHKSKKIGFDKFLFHTKDGIIDTEIVVNPIPSELKLKEDENANMGMIELRLCIIRRLGDEHALRDIPVYYERIDEGFDMEETATYSSIPPQFAMSFEKDVPPLDKIKANAAQRKMQAKRPGTEPWAIFRFHYRDKQSILEMELEQSFCAAEKNNGSPYTLDIEELPMLALPPKPSKPVEGEEASTRHSSPAPSGADTATKSMAEDVSRATTTSQQRKNKKAMSDLVTDTQSRERSSSPQTTIDATEEERAQLLRNFVDSPPKSLSMLPPASTTIEHSKITDSSEATELTGGGSEDIGGKDVDKNLEATMDSDLNRGSTTDDGVMKLNSSTITKTTTTHGDGPTHTLPLVTSTPLVTPIKRVAELTPPSSPLEKRAKPSPLPPFSPTPNPSAFPSPRIGSLGGGGIERKLAEQRRRLAEAREKRAKINQKQVQIEERLAPYKQRMAEELAEIERLAQEEEAAQLEEEANLKASLEMLSEYQGDGQ